MLFRLSLTGELKIPFCTSLTGLVAVRKMCKIMQWAENTAMGKLCMGK